MKLLILGLGLVVCSVSFAAASEGTALNISLESDPLELPAPPELPPQPLALAPLFQKTVKVIDPRALIRAAARKHRVHAALVISIVAAESNFDPSAISAKGAIGLMQLMPETAQLFGADATIPEQNVDAGAQYLRALIDKYHKYHNWLTRVIAAYNAGPGVVDHYHGVPPYRETKTYVARVLAFMKKFQRELA